MADDRLSHAPKNGRQELHQRSAPPTDPTTLTTAALYREVAALQELVELNIGSLKELITEKFNKTEQQFDLVERQRVEQKKDTKDAVDAALTAQKEAVKEQTTASERAIAKSETATNKQLEQLASTFASKSDELRRSIDEIKERTVEADRSNQARYFEVDRKAEAFTQQRAGAKEDRSGLYATIAIIATVLTIIISSMVIISTRSAEPNKSIPVGTVSTP